jgi:hypothetical protein
MKLVSLLMWIGVAPLVALADGGAVCLHEASGPFLVTVFVSPSPLRAGPIDTSVLVQDQQTGAVILDAAIKLVVQPLSAEGPRELAEATHEHATNKLLQAATLNLQESGWWVLNVVVSRGREEAVLATKLEVAPAMHGLAVIWPFVLIPFFAIGLFAIHQMRCSGGL